MKKDLIILTTHCNTPTKKELLLNLLIQFQSFREHFDILIASHIPLDEIFFPYIDFHYFDKNNYVLTDQKYTQNAWFRPTNNYVVWSSYADYGNTMIAIWDMIIPSIQLAKSHGYQKLHYIEYDTFFPNDNELLDNSDLLNEHDYIFYNSKSTHPLVGAYFAFRTDSIIEEWEKIDHNNIKKIIESSYPKAPERLIHKMITTQKKYLEKNVSQLTDSGVEINLSRGSKIYWQVPFYEPNTNKLKFIVWNNNNESYFTKVIVNEALLFHFEPISHNNWRMIDLLDNFDEVKTIKVFRNDKIVLDLNFSDEKAKHDFKYYNSALSDESIIPPKI